MSHELTHFIQEYAAEEYDELRSFVVGEVMKKSPAEFDRLVRQQMRWVPGISYEGAVNELVANGCMTMLQNTQAVKQLVREHMTLAERMAERISEIGQQLKEAFGTVDVNDNAPIYQAAKLLQESFGEIQTRFDKALAAATENYNAEKAAERATGEKKNASREAGVQYQKTEQEEILHLKEQVRAHIDEIMSMPVLASVESGITFDENNIQEAVAWIVEQIGAPLSVTRIGFGDVEFTKKRINRGFNYLPGKKGDAFRNPVGQALTTACVAASTVVENGKQIEHHKNHKGYGYPTWTFAGPVEIDGETGVLTVVVKRTTGNFYDVHSIMTPDGDLLVLDKNMAEVSDGGASKTEGVAPPKLSAKDSIADTAGKSKSQKAFENVYASSESVVSAIEKATMEDGFSAFGIRADVSGYEAGYELDNSHEWLQDDPSDFATPGEYEYNKARGMWRGGELNGVSVVQIKVQEGKVKIS